MYIVPHIRSMEKVHVRWRYEPSINATIWRRGTSYNHGIGCNHYPVPAIWYEHKIIPDPFMVNGAFMVELRNSLGWADYVCYGDGTDDHTTWAKDLCRNCGSFVHRTEECFLS